MAKYDVTMSCGHVQTVQLFGKMTDRENKIAWLEKHGVCNECKKAETERKQAEETAKAAEKAIADNLPDITGTEKQVNWALTIRARLLAEVDKKIADNKDRMDAEKLAKAELQAKAIKKVVANKFTTAKFWIDNRDSILQQIIKNNNLAEEIKAEIANLQAAEVKEETEMKKARMIDQPHYMGIVSKGVAREELTFPNFKAAYRAFKAIENADNLVSVIIGHDDGETYTSAYYKNVYDKEEGITAKTGKKDPVNAEYYAEIESVIAEVTAELSAEENVTAENSVNNNKNGADSDELLALKVRHTNLEIQKRKSGIKVGLERIRDKQEEILQYTGKILEVEDVISNLTAFILNDKLVLDELQTKAAALENEVANRKIVDAIDDIGGSADAINASVAAMIELNAVNAQVDTAVENVVKFEIQNFAADVNIADSYATIDTAVSGTVIPVIDEDAEIKNQLAEIAKLTNREKELEQQIAALQEDLNAVQREYVKKDWNLTKYAKDLMDAVYQTVKTAFEKRTEWGCIEINGVMMQSWHWDEYNAVRTKFDDSGFALWFYDDTVPREYQYTEFVKYSTFKQFKAAISELAEAIERGAKTFTFPADETADK